MNNTPSLDEKDRFLLKSLQSDATVSNADLARQIGLSASGLQKRLRKLEDQGLFIGRKALLNREMLGFDMLCFVHVSFSHHKEHYNEGFRKAVRDMSEVLECHLLTGEFDYLLKVIVKNRGHLEAFLIERLAPLEGIDKYRTSLVISEVKNTTEIPV